MKRVSASGVYVKGFPVDIAGLKTAVGRAIFVRYFEGTNKFRDDFYGVIRN
jgi:hypothetical protein